MDYYRRKFIAVVGLAQAGAICISVLAARTGLKMVRSSDLPLRVPCCAGFMADWGWLLLALPLVWSVVAFLMARKIKGRDWRLLVMATVGITVALVFLLYAGYAATEPLRTTAAEAAG